MGKEEKSIGNKPLSTLLPRSTVFQISTSFARIFLAMLSPREFRRATEAGSSLLPQGVARFRHICHLTLRQKFNILK